MKIFSFLLCFLSVQVIMAQAFNDDCFTPEELNIQLGSYCSEIAEFDNIDATLSADARPSCWPILNNERDIWFSFRAAGNATNISINGLAQRDAGGTMVLPQLAVYSGICGNLTERVCVNDGFSANYVEIIADQLTVGQRYYIRVTSEGNTGGTFQMCITSYNIIPPPESDCISAVLLCDKSSFNVEKLEGVGQNTNEVGFTCVQEEFASSWYKWVCDVPGTLTFTLTPNNPIDDLDFLVYELPGGLDDCDNKTVLRCMASGENIDADLDNWQRCMGPTGLQFNDPDLVETAGCMDSDNNYVRHIDMEVGKAYMLMVNNFSRSGGGFVIDFDGSSTFLGPDATFSFLDGQTLDSIECDKTFTIQEMIDFPTGNIDTIYWNFGESASPLTAQGPGPHTFSYSGVGIKSIVLTMETERGCFYTEILNFNVEPCCSDFDPMVFEPTNVEDLICADIPSGSAQVEVLANGIPFFEYSENGIDWQFNNVFRDLDAGMFQYFVRDRKGCVDSTTVTISAPPPLEVDLGPDETLQLGCDIDIDAIVLPNAANVSYNWTSRDTSVLAEIGSMINVIPPGTTTYYIEVIDEAGCIAVDTIVIFLDEFRPIFVPTAFSPNDDAINDRITVFGNKATKEILNFQIYNRWGNQVFSRSNFQANDLTFGWDGTFNNQILDPAVFVYQAEVLFVDNVVQVFKGEINLIK